VLEALAIVRESGTDAPVIVISGDIEDVLALLKAGAADHMTRGNLMRLNAAVARIALGPHPPGTYAP
jgi:hypothetical protein